MKSLVLTILSVCILFTSCQMSPCGFSKEQFKSGFQKLVKNAKAADRKASDPAWEMDDSKFEQFVTGCYEEYEADMTMDEKRSFWIDAVRYLIYRYGWGLVNEITDPDNQEEIIRVVRENAQEVLDGAKEIRRVIREELRDNPRLDELQNEVNNFFEKLKEEFK